MQGSNELGTVIDPLDPSSHTQGIINLVTGRITRDNVNVDNSISVGTQQMPKYESFWSEGLHSSLSKKVITLVITKKHTQVDQTTEYDTDLIYTYGSSKIQRN